MRKWALYYQLGDAAYVGDTVRYRKVMRTYVREFYPPHKQALFWLSIGVAWLRQTLRV